MEARANAAEAVAYTGSNAYVRFLPSKMFQGFVIFKALRWTGKRAEQPLG
jgi:hypothetical protein